MPFEPRPPLTIRAADERDVSVLVGLNQVVQALHVAALPRHFKQPDGPSLEQSFRFKLRRPGVGAWLACHAERAVGYAIGAVHERPETALCVARRYYEIEEIAVVSSHRRQGVARKLIEQLLLEARARNLRDVELTSWAFNAEAHVAFETLGFRPLLVRFARESE